MKQLSFRLSPLALFAVLATGGFAALFSIEQVYNYDIWWHLRSGLLTLTERGIPYVDSLSFSSQGTEWVNTAWLSGVLLAIIEKIGGIDLLIVVKATIVGIAFGAAALMLVRKGVHPLLAVALLGVAVVIARFRFLLRPQVLVFPGAVALFWFLSDYTGRKKWLMLAAGAATVLWVNLHGSAFLVPVFCIFLLAEALIESRFNRADRVAFHAPSISAVLLLLLVTAVAMFATPYGAEVPRLVFGRFVIDDIISNHISVEEHLPLVWGARKLFWALMIATGASFAAQFRMVRPFNLLTYVGTSVLALSSVRYVGFAALLHAMLLALNLQGLLPHLTQFKRSVRRFAAGAGVILLCLAGVWAFQDTFGGNKVYKWGLGINTSRYPVEAVNYLKRAEVQGNLFNSWEAGGYLLWFLPEVRTSMDGRVLPAQQRQYDAWHDMSRTQFSEDLQKHDVRAALLNKSDAPFVQFFDTLPNYRLKYFDSSYLVYLRDDVALPAELEPSMQFRYVRPQSFDYSYLVPLASGAQADEVEAELRRAVAMSPNNFVIRFQLGIFLEIRNNPEAIDMYLTAAQLNPSLAFSHFKIGLQAGRFAIRHKQWDKAVGILRSAIENGNESADHYSLLGTAYARLGDHSKAEKAFRNALNRQPEHLSALLGLGMLLAESDRYDEAEEFFRQSLAVSPDNEAAYYGLAYLLHLQRKPEAADAWRDFLQRFPNGRGAINAHINLKKLER